MRTGTARAIIVRSHVKLLARLGLNTAALLEAVGISPEQLADPDARVPLAPVVRLFEAAERLLRDESLGLRVGELVEERHVDVVGYAMRCCATLGEALGRLVRYHRLLHDAPLTVEAAPGVAYVTHGEPGHPLGLVRATEQLVIARLVALTRRISGLDWAPRRVDFQHERPRDCSAYERLFRARVRFGTARTRLVLDAALLQVPLRQADDALLNVLDRYADQLVGRLPAGPGAGDQVRFLIAKELAGGDVTKEAIARKLHMSPRTLQRALAAEGTSFREILDALRRGLALHYLEERDVALAEVSYLLGFSEVSAFYHAFRRWTGTTPAEHRRALRT